VRRFVLTSEDDDFRILQYKGRPVTTATIDVSSPVVCAEVHMQK